MSIGSQAEKAYDSLVTEDHAKAPFRVILPKAIPTPKDNPTPWLGTSALLSIKDNAPLKVRELEGDNCPKS